MKTSSAQVHSWWVQALRGLLAIVFGLAILTWPSYALFTLRILVALFGIYAIVDGVFAIVTTLIAAYPSTLLRVNTIADGVFAIVATVRAIRRHTPWTTRLLEGLGGIAVGVLILVWPAVTAMVVLYFIVAWSIVTGILKVIAAIKPTEWLLLTSGVASVLFGLLLVAVRGEGALAVVWLIGAFALVFGVLQLGQAAQLFGRRP